MKKFILLFLLPVITSGQITVFNQISGSLEIRDGEYYKQLDVQVQRLYDEHIALFNKGMGFYNNADYVSAYYYFNRSFNFGMFARLKVKPEDEVMQNKALYQLLSIVKIDKPKSGDVQDAKELVDDWCDPIRKKQAYDALNEYKQSKKKKKRVEK